MTAILNTEIHVRIQVERIDEHLFQLTMKKGKASVDVVINDVEAYEVSNVLNLIIQNSNHGTEKNS